ncbi:hydrogenase iron-sulfur subunit [bacterium]|nr:hydrogenase iron-sulfur subunit [bacterium]
MAKFEPKIIAFACNWCTSAGADLAGTSRMKYQPNSTIIRVMCSSRVDPQHILRAFKQGADGVFVGGCHPGDCHYLTGNYNTLRRVKLLKKMMQDMGIDPQRLQLEWVSAAEGQKFVQVINEFTDKIRKLGALNLSKETSN